MLPEFDFLTPRTLAEALAQLSDAGKDALPLCGGTNVIPDLRSGRHHPKIVIDLSRLSQLRGIWREDRYLCAGSGVTLSEILGSPLVADHASPLREAARSFANPLIRNRASLGGNLVDASPAADCAPPLLVLDAEVILESESGRRCLPLNEFFTGVRSTVRQPEELLVQVRWTTPPVSLVKDGVISAFACYKLGLRKADAISVVSVAVRLDMDENGTCTQARIALGSVAPRPMRALAAEHSLRGQQLSEAGFVQAGKLAAEAVSPISDLRASASYRRRMVAVLVHRLLNQAVAEIMETRKPGLKAR